MCICRRGRERPSSRYGRRSVTPDDDELSSSRGKFRRAPSVYESDEELRTDRRKKKYRGELKILKNENRVEIWDEKLAKVSV